MLNEGYRHWVTQVSHGLIFIESEESLSLKYFDVTYFKNKKEEKRKEKRKKKR